MLHKVATLEQAACNCCSTFAYFACSCADAIYYQGTCWAKGCTAELQVFYTSLQAGSDSYLMLKEPIDIGCLQRQQLDIKPAWLLQNDAETRHVCGCQLMLTRWAPMAIYPTTIAASSHAAYY